MKSKGFVGLMMAIVLLAGACGPSSTGSGASSAETPSASARPRVITIGTDAEPPEIEGFNARIRLGGTGVVKEIVHNYLVEKDDFDILQPQLAAELPTVDKGSWRINDDASMDMTWKLVPNVKWHDGTPFTSADLLFSYTVYKDPDIPPTVAASFLRQMETATAPDDLTFVVHWSQTNAQAQEAAGLVPLPRHLMESVYQSDKDAFVKSPRFRSDFVGLGPYKLSSWELGAYMEFVRFDDYFAGRPPFDRVTMRFVNDPDTMVANMLAGVLDAVPTPRIELLSALELKRRVETDGNVVRIEPAGRIHFGEIQYRTEIARPRNGLTNLLVRQAMLSATDRQSLSDAITEGYAPVADSYTRPTDPWRAETESAVVKYPFDLGRAQQLLTQAGWERGVDGVLVNRETGDVFEAELWATPTSGLESEPTIMADQWNKTGARVTPYLIPAARSSDRELQARVPTMTVAGRLPPDGWYTDRLDSRFIASADNQWSGRNKLAYSNPQVDLLLRRLQLTIDTAQRIALHRQVLQAETADVAFMPLYWEVQPSYLAKGVTPSQGGLQNLTNFVAWRRD